MDITKQSEKELKALAYDQLRERDRINQNLAVIERELALREAERSDDAVPVDESDNPPA